MAITRHGNYGGPRGLYGDFTGKELASTVFTSAPFAAVSSMDPFDAVSVMDPFARPNFMDPFNSEGHE